MDLFKEVRKEELRKKAIDELLQAQNKIISDCQERYNYYRIQLEKINILEHLTKNIVIDKEEKEKFNHEISSALNEAKQATELKNKLENLR
ncbi:hypothetical protein [Clostridium magnum]|uniref:Uncharacterized protein n=1 Tax=Clostridium magnum DSM 2767 TaxID=1121326 RepID=A0A162UEM6_9CLOT|nr:hypothetical protein [Clostridium magnum]KZL93817.1 hypothetical protein CLMAG_08690 [Clostridium magnum DSM 2767]SHI08363.1 hypothetical protein SAMN02745944_02379 [Clostridium magnum DSM 2767]